MGTVNSLFNKILMLLCTCKTKYSRLAKAEDKEGHLVGTQTAWKVFKYGVISGEYFPVFSPNSVKYGPEITPYWDTFHAVAN